MISYRNRMGRIVPVNLLAKTKNNFYAAEDSETKTQVIIHRDCLIISEDIKLETISIDSNATPAS